MANGHDIDIVGLQKQYVRRDGTAVRAVDDISLRIGRGEFVVLLGPSGCGKTTLLRCIAGLEQPDRGAIRIGQRTVFDAATRAFIPPERRRIGMMFQSYALWPHMTILDNVRFPLRMQSAPKAEAAARIAHVLDIMHIADLVGQYPGQLSGGQQQRVALARALVCSDDLILFDEPLSNVDAKVREHLRNELGIMHKRLGFTAIYVTHDQDEAMALADRIVVLAGGSILQEGPPTEVYSKPRDARVAGFVGLANLLDGRRIDGGTGGTVPVQTALGTVPVPADRVQARGTDVVLVSRPEQWRIASGDGGAMPGQRWRGTVRLVVHLGPHTDYVVDLAGQEIRVRDYGARTIAVGDAVTCAISPESLLVVDHQAAARPGPA